MKKIFPVLALLLLCTLSYSQNTVEKWGRFEFSCKAAVRTNPFDVKFTATFTNGSETKTVRGFYDGIDTWNMTVTEYPGVYELAAGTKYRMYDTLNSIIRLPETPYLLLRIKEAE